MTSFQSKIKMSHGAIWSIMYMMIVFGYVNDLIKRRNWISYFVDSSDREVISIDMYTLNKIYCSILTFIVFINNPDLDYILSSTRTHSLDGYREEKILIKIVCGHKSLYEICRAHTAMRVFSITGCSNFVSMDGDELYPSAKHVRTCLLDIIRNKFIIIIMNTKWRATASETKKIYQQQNIILCGTKKKNIAILAKTTFATSGMWLEYHFYYFIFISKWVFNIRYIHINVWELVVL